MNYLSLRECRTLRFLVAAVLALATINITAPAHALTDAVASRETSLPELDEAVRAEARGMGRRVDSGVVNVAGRADWKVDYEFISGDSRQPLVVLANGFVWPRENAAPMWAAFLQSAKGGLPAYNLLRFDMSGQGRTIALYSKEGPAPWYMSEALTLEKLRKEMAAVVQHALQANGLPTNHPVILLGLSYGRSILPTELAPQARMVIEIAPMIRPLNAYKPEGIAWRNALDWMRLNPFLAPVADRMQLDGWRKFYRKFYASNPDRLPKGVVPEWYIEGAALRTNAADAYLADRHVFSKSPHLLFMAEVDDIALKRDQLRYFSQSLSQQTGAAVMYMRHTGHGMTVDFNASAGIIAFMNQVMRDGMWDRANRVLDVDMTSRTPIKPTTVEQLLQEQKDEGTSDSTSKP